MQSLDGMCDRGTVSRGWEGVRDGYSPKRKVMQDCQCISGLNFSQSCSRDIVVWTASIIDADFKRGLGKPTAAREFFVSM